MANQENNVWWPTSQLASVVRAMQLLEMSGTEYSTPKGPAKTPYWHVRKITDWAEPLAWGTGKEIKAESWEKSVRGILSLYGLKGDGPKDECFFEGGGDGLYRLTKIGRDYRGG